MTPARRKDCVDNVAIISTLRVADIALYYPRVVNGAHRKSLSPGQQGSKIRFAGRDSVNRLAWSLTIIAGKRGVAMSDTLQKLLLGLFAISALITSGGELAAQQLERSGTESVSAESDGSEELLAEEIVVLGVRRSLSQARDLKRESEQFVDFVVADDIGKLPDANVAE